MPLTGRCNCGAVTATIAGAPVQVRQCWCRQCQRTAAGQATTNAIFATDAVTISGPLTRWSYIAPSGNELTQSFCPQCGTPVMAQSSARPQFRTMRVGFLDDGHGLAPQVIIWTREAPAWAHFPADAEHHEGQPPPPPSQSLSSGAAKD